MLILRVLLAVVLLAGLMFVLGPSMPAVAGPATGYSYSQQITIDHTKVSGGSDLTNFPVLISMTDSFLISASNGGFVQNSSGYDIIFTDSSQSTKLDHEIEHYVPTTGEIEMWVRIPTLSHTTDTVIDIVYGNSSISTSQENKNGVWDSSYLGVWHMSDKAANTTVADSTSITNTGTAAANTTTNSTSGKVANGLNFNGNSDFVNTTSGGSIKGQSQVTISAWVNTSALLGQEDIYFEPTSVGTTKTKIALDLNGASHNFELAGRPHDADSSKTVFATNTTSLSTSTWYYVVGVFDSVSGTHHLMVNGVDQTNAASVSSFDSTAPITTPRIGEQADGTQYWAGTLDDVRISDTARSVGWNTTEYNNQSSPSTFFSVAGLTGLSSQNVTVGIPIQPAFTFSVANQSSACNGESNFISGAGTGTAVNLGNAVNSSNYSGGQALSVTGNASNGFAVYVRGTQASQNLRSAGRNWADVTGTYASPAALGAGERFGYTYKDSTTSSSVTNPASANFMALTNAATNAVMGSTSSQSGSGCISFDVQTGATTKAGTYTATVIYSAVPTF